MSSSPIRRAQRTRATAWACLPRQGNADLLGPGLLDEKQHAGALQTDAAAGIYGPGHNSFTTDGDDDVLVYHAREYRDIRGDPLYDLDRDTRAEAVTWGPTGHPSSNLPGRLNRTTE